MDAVKNAEEVLTDVLKKGKSPRDPEDCTRIFDAMAGVLGQTPAELMRDYVAAARHQDYAPKGSYEDNIMFWAGVDSGIRAMSVLFREELADINGMKLINEVIIKTGCIARIQQLKKSQSH